MGYSPGGGGGSGPSPATTVTGPDAYGASAVVGTGTHYARNDHNHGLPAAPGGLLARVQYAPSTPQTYILISIRRINGRRYYKHDYFIYGSC